MEVQVKSEGLQQFENELMIRYIKVPQHDVVDVEYGERNRVFHMLQQVAGKEEPEVHKFSTRSNCRRCWGYGYNGVLEPRGAKPGDPMVLYVCNCLKLIKEKKKDD